MSEYPEELREKQQQAVREASPLDEDDIREIRRRYAKDDGPSQTELAEEFEITQPNICAIVNRKTWKLDDNEGGIA